MLFIDWLEELCTPLLHGGNAFLVTESALLAARTTKQVSKALLPLSLGHPWTGMLLGEMSAVAVSPHLRNIAPVVMGGGARDALRKASGAGPTAPDAAVLNKAHKFLSSAALSSPGFR